MAIKEYIYLLGVEEVNASLDRLKAKGEESLAGFRDLGGAKFGEPFEPISDGAKGAAEATEKLTISAHDLHSIFYVLRPVLQAAGFEVGQFAAMGRLASVGIGGIAAAAAGAVVVGLARLEDAARTTKGQLDDLFQSKALSEKAFAGIQASASQFNTTVANIVPGIEALKIAWDRFITETRTFKFVAPSGGDIGQIIPPGMIGSVENLQEVYNNFLKLLRAGRLDQAAATEAAKVFFTAMQNGGKLTADILRTLPVGTINQLALAMGRGTIGTQQFVNEVKLAPIGLDRLLQALARFTLESDQAFRDNAIITYRDKIGEIIATLSDLFKTTTGTFFSDFIVNELDKLAKGIAKNREQIEWFKSWILFIESKTNIPIPWWMQGTVGNRPSGIPGGGAPAPETTDETNRVWEAAGISARDRFAKGFRDAPTAAVDIANTVKSDAKLASETFGKGWVDAPKAIEKAAGDGAETAKNAWDLFFDGLKAKWEEWKKSLSGFQLGIAPAGAAEFTGGPLLQQQQEQGQIQPIVAPFQDADNQIRTIWIALMDYISTSVNEIDFTPVTQALVTPFTNALPGIRDALLQVEQMIREIVRQALEAGQIIQQLNQGGRPGGGGGGGGFIEIAGGGYIRGPGTSTSDSIPAWLSNREFVIRAKAVDHYGASLFAALNSMRLPKDLFSHFAIGGLASALARTMPRYAGGGMATASAGRSLTIVLDGQRFGLNGPADVVDQLERRAAMSGLASIGRPPGWVR